MKLHKATQDGKCPVCESTYGAGALLLLNDDVSTQRYVAVTYKAALFIAGNSEIDDAFGNDPSQFDIAFDPATFVAFCREYAPMHVFWQRNFILQRDGGSDWGNYWYPPTLSGVEDWDVTVKRKMAGEDALWLLINSASSLVGNEQEFGHALRVEARTLITD